MILIKNKIFESYIIYQLHSNNDNLYIHFLTTWKILKKK